jgi:ketosteroid isomerase-like protein
MSQENVEIVRRIYGARMLDDATLVEVIDVDFEYVNPPDAVSPGTRRGPEVGDALRSLAESFSWSENRLHRVFDAGDRVVAEVTFHARGTASGAELRQDEAHTWTFRDGRLVRFEWSRDLDDALEAVGLRE